MPYGVLALSTQMQLGVLIGRSGDLADVLHLERLHSALAMAGPPASYTCTSFASSALSWLYFLWQRWPRWLLPLVGSITGSQSLRRPEHKGFCGTVFEELFDVSKGDHGVATRILEPAPIAALMALTRSREEEK